MNQTLISTVVSDLLKSEYPYEATKGFVWKKDPDEYDQINDLIWEGDWNLVPETNVDTCCLGMCCCCSKDVKVANKHCEWKCPNGHMENHYCYMSDKWFTKYEKEHIESQRETIVRTLNPDYHTCIHETHEICTKSVCCDFFWHEGECYFVSDVDGEKEGYAVRFGGY
jgi:hypothetical protein